MPGLAGLCCFFLFIWGGCILEGATGCLGCWEGITGSPLCWAGLIDVLTLALTGPFLIELRTVLVVQAIFLLGSAKLILKCGSSAAFEFVFLSKITLVTFEGIN